jgi:hypothetical protein
MMMRMILLNRGADETVPTMCQEEAWRKKIKRSTERTTTAAVTTTTFQLRSDAEDTVEHASLPETPEHDATTAMDASEENRIVRKVAGLSLKMRGTVEPLPGTGGFGTTICTEKKRDHHCIETE